MTVESPKREHHDSFCRLLGELFSNDTIIPGVQGTLLSAGDLQRAIYQFLAVLDDLLIDAPLAVGCTYCPFLLIEMIGCSCHVMAVHPDLILCVQILPFHPY